MRTLLLLLLGVVIGGEVAIVAASLSVLVDLRIPALVLAVSAGIWWGSRAVRRERAQWRAIQEYLAEPDEQLEEA